jgi:hypothetical protein
MSCLLIRAAENTTAQTWRTLRHELDRMHLVTLVTLATPNGTVAQRSLTTPDPFRESGTGSRPRPGRGGHHVGAWPGLRGDPGEGFAVDLDQAHGGPLADPFLVETGANRGRATRPCHDR